MWHILLKNIDLERPLVAVGLLAMVKQKPDSGHGCIAAANSP